MRFWRTGTAPWGIPTAALLAILLLLSGTGTLRADGAATNDAPAANNLPTFLPQEEPVPGPVTANTPAAAEATPPGESPSPLQNSSAPVGNGSPEEAPAEAEPPQPPPKPAPPVFPGPKTLPPTGPWKPLYFDNDFSYKSKPDHEYLFGEEFKNLILNDDSDNPLTFSAGGEVRHRYMNENNRLRPGGPIHTDYNLWRWRQYADLRWGDIRIYGEGIEADSFGSVAPDQAIDVNRWDIQNLFVDYTFYHDEGESHTLRYGRQELLFGRQRLVSPLDWANTRRNFEGVRYLAKVEDMKMDLFVTHPVNSATGFQPVGTYDSRFDQPNYHVWFSGAYFSYTGLENTVIDNYWLYLDTGSTQDPTKPDGRRHLLGSRLARLLPVAEAARVWDFDTEYGIQLGTDNGESVLAGFYSHCIGHTWKTAPLSPRLSHTFYYGSGDRSPGSGHNNTFNTLFPLGHAYWAISDNLSGQNLYDLAVQADVKPTQQTTFTSAYHWFELASNGDRLYNVAGAPVGKPGNGRDIGQALDLYGSYSYNANFDIQVGYSWFWYGEYIQRTAPRNDATQFYVQTSFRY